jgi:hypothetical protein
MSDDLVERIERWMCSRRGEDQCGCPSCVILAEAAAEIRRLREQVAELEAELGYHGIYPNPITRLTNLTPPDRKIDTRDTVGDSDGDDGA